MRRLISLLSGLIAAVTLLLAWDKLSVLLQHRVPGTEFSAIQVTQVNSEAQTILLFGILGLLMAVVLQLGFLRDALPPARAETALTPTSTSNPVPASVTRASATSETRICPHCGQRNPAFFELCGTCQTRLPAASTQT